MTFRLLILFCLLCRNLSAQEDYSWWNDKHNWDGHTPWHQYITLSSAFMGPNALPVPEVKKGILSPEFEVELLAGAHFSKGDKTQDIFSRIYFPLLSGKVALETYFVPIEFYKMDTITRDQRAARTRSGKGHAGGDIYFSTQVQLLQNRESWPDVAFELAFRTASGTKLRDARYTDAPGYYMDVSFGKSFALASDRDIELRLFAMLGLYVYQTYDWLHLQNDAWMEGIGADLRFGKFSIVQTVSGYRGYLDIGDKPVVYRASVKWMRRKLDGKIWFQSGIHDYPYRSIRIGMVYHLAN